MIKKLLYGLHNFKKFASLERFKKFVKTIKHYYKRKKTLYCKGFLKNIKNRKKIVSVSGLSIIYY